METVGSPAPTYHLLRADGHTVGIIRTMVAEMVPERELQPRAFSIMPLVWSIGSIFGPAFGGLFANPAKQFPSAFGDSPFFIHYPFALPNMLGSIVFLVSVATGGLFLKETLASKRDQRDWGLVLGEKLTKPFKKRSQRKSRRYSFQDDEASAPLLQAETGRGERPQPVDTRTEKPVPPSLKLVFTRQSVITLVSYTFLALHSVAYDQVLPVFLHFSREKHDGSNTQLPFVFSGGFGLDSGRIGTINMVYGIFCGLIQFILFPPLCARFGTLRCFRACAVIFPIAYLLTPFTVLIEDTTMRYVALFSVLVLKAAAVIIGFPCTTILLTNSARSLHVLASLNGFATTFSALGRAAGPAMTGAAFSWGVKRGVVSVPYWILAAVAVLGAVPAWWIVEGEGPAREPEALDDDDEDGAAEDSDATKGPTAPTEQSARPKLIAPSARSPGAEPLDAREDDATSHEPNAGDDLPLVGSWKSNHGAAGFGGHTVYGAIGHTLGRKAADPK